MEFSPAKAQSAVGLRVTTDKKVRAGTPTIAGLGHNVARIIFGANVVGVLPVGMLSVEQRVDFAGAEAGQIDFEMQIDQLLQLDLEDLVGPTGLLRKLIVCKNIGAPFCSAKMLNPKRWHMLHAKQFCSLDATVAGQNLVVAVDQNRVRKSELVNRAGDLFNLLSGVGSGVIWVRSKVADLQRHDLSLIAIV